MIGLKGIHTLSAVNEQPGLNRTMIGLKDITSNSNSTQKRGLNRTMIGLKGPSHLRPNAPAFQV